MRHGHPLAGAGPAAAGHKGMEVEGEVEPLCERLDDGDHPGEETSSPPAATVISLRTVSQAEAQRGPRRPR